MAVITEPGWMNQVDGNTSIAGGTSRTINFGFTSTAGNFLLAVAYGAVTHAAAGWNERLSPVDSGELSVFTKTSAGDDHIDLTHNGAGYAIAYAIYEFPAGTTWLTGAGTSTGPGATDFPTLSGMTSAAKTIFAARGRVYQTGATVAATSDFSEPPWVEDAELVLQPTATEGCFLGVARQINLTDTVFTPTAGVNWVTGTGDGNIQVISFALNVAAGGIGGGDTAAPTAPTSLTATSPTTTGGSLAWTQGTDAVGVTQNVIKVNGLVHATIAAATSYNITGLASSTTYSITVTAKDAAGNESAASNTASLTTTAPPASGVQSYYSANGSTLDSMLQYVSTNGTTTTPIGL